MANARELYSRRSITRPARLASLTLLALVSAAAHTPSVSGDAPMALAPASIWARGFLQPRGVAIDAQDAAFVSDRLAGTVTRIDQSQSKTTVLRGLDRPIGLAFDREGRLLVAEERAGRVMRREADGSRTALVTGIKQPRWLAVADDATVFIAARRLTRGTDPEPDDESAEPEVILAYTATGALTVFADGFRALRGLAAGDGVLYAATDGRRGDSRSGGVVLRIPILPGARAGAASPIGSSATFTRPMTLAQDQLGALFVTTVELSTDGQRSGGALAKVHPGGRVNLFAGELDRPQGVAFDSTGNLYLAEGISGRVLRFLAPPAPDLTPLAAMTNQPALRVSGTGLARARVDGRLDGAGGRFTTQSDAAGSFALTIPLSPNAENIIEIFTTAYGGDGLTGEPGTAIARHDDVPPETVMLSGAQSPSDAATITLAFTGTDDVTAPGDLDFAWRLDGRPFSEFSTARSATVTDLIDGAHAFEVVARDRAGNVDPTPATMTFTVSRSRIALVEPEPGATLPAGLRLVRGTLAASAPEISVTINGVVAAVNGNSFAALVPLTTDTNRLQIVATTDAGVVASQDVPVTVTAAPDSPFFLVTSPPTGVAPMAVSFTLLGVPEGSTVQADFEGDGTIEVAGPRLDDQVFTYTQPGLYVARIAVTDALGQQTIVPGVVQVFDRTSLDALLQAKWTALRDALRRGDIAQAMTQVSTRSRTRYQQAFATLTPDLPAIDTILTSLQFARTRGPEALFEMSRTDAGTLKSFEVRFHVDADGFWRLRSF